MSLTFNPIIKFKDPPVYLTELFIYQAIEEFIIDTIVELCQNQYYPVFMLCDSTHQI